MKFKVLISILILVLGVFPALAQTTTINTVSFNGFSFSFDSAVATNVNISTFAGDAADLQQPGGPEVAHTEFLLYNVRPAPESMFDAVGGIRVYNTADFANYPDSQTQFDQLQGLLTSPADLTPFMVVNADATGITLPFLPNMPASQVIRTRVQYMETASVRGVSYVTVYRQDVSPFVSGEFLYTFQGVSTDGTKYVSAIFRVDASVIPSEIPADFDMDTFTAGFAEYLTESVNQLNTAAPESFTPALPLLDAIIQSFSFASTGTGVVTAPTATATIVNDDPTLGGLAGVTWTLISYGAPEAPQAALPTPPVTAIFSETGVGGSSGCNSYGGTFRYDNGALTFSDVVGTLMACEELIMAQETAYLTALASATSYQIADNQLRIAYNGGVLVFSNGVVPTATVPVTATAIETATATATP